MTREELLKENEELKIKLANAKLELDNLKRVIFGTKREYTPKVNTEEIEEQCSFFEDEKDIENDVQEQIKERLEEITVHKKKNAKKKKAGIKKELLKNIIVERKEYVLEDGEVCPKCQSELKVIGKKIVRQEIEFEPARIKIKDYVKTVYKCVKCGTSESEKASNTILESVVPKALITHSFASPSLATEVIYQKYYLGVPLYRQEKMWDDRGLVLPRNMMANWNIKISEYYLEPLYELMQKKIKEESQLLHCDETTIQCNKETGRKATSNSYMWVMRSGETEKNKGVIFKYAPSRSAETAKEFLRGYKGILVTDGYASYNNIESIKHAECWAHARRYFYESIPLLDNKKMDTTTDGYVGVRYCDKLFKIEQEIALLSEDKKIEVRQEKSKPIVEEFFNWVKLTLTEKIVVNKKLKNALTYALNQQKELSEFLNDGKIPLTNSLAERAIRPFAVHRKNWLFADSVNGAKANAIMYSLIESAKVNNLNIYGYINYLLRELPQIEDINEQSKLEKYLPWSEELPKDILNFQGAYEDLKIDE